MRELSLQDSLAVHCSCFDDAGDARIIQPYLPFLFALDCLPLCFCRDGLGTPLVGCGGYAGEKARRDRKSLTYYQRRPANQNHCFDVVRVFAMFTEEILLYSLFSHTIIA
jgi:hypothetical protein